MPQKAVTFEEVDKHIQAANLDRFKPGGTHHIAATGGATGTASTSQLCAIYAVVKPILFMVSAFWFFPQKWRDAMSLYIQAMDVICPTP